MLDEKLITFLDLCQTHSFTKTAENLNITQPTVSRHIRILEDRYDTMLYSYNGHVFQLTEAGITLYRFLYPIQADAERVKAVIRSESPSKRKFRIGTEIASGSFFIPQLIMSLLQNDPDHIPSFAIENSSSLYAMLERGELDFIITDNTSVKPGYSSYELFPEDDLVCVCSPSHPLANQHVHMEKLYSQTLIIGMPGTPTRKKMDFYFEKNNFSAVHFPKHIEISNSTVAVKQLLFNNVGISFYYRCAVAKELNEHSLSRIYVDDFCEKYTYKLVISDNLALRPYLGHLLSFLRDFFQKCYFETL